MPLPVRKLLPLLLLELGFPQLSFREPSLLVGLLCFRLCLLVLGLQLDLPFHKIKKISDLKRLEGLIDRRLAHEGVTFPG